MEIHTVQLPSAEAVEFEEHLVADGFVLALKDGPEGLEPKEYLKRVTASDEDLSGEEFIFTWKQ